MTHTLIELGRGARKALIEVGDAWSATQAEFNGPTLRAQVRGVVEIDAGTLTLDDFRRKFDLCPSGGGHWTRYCRDECRARTDERSET